MKKKDLCQSLINIANKLDESGYYKEANKLTSTVNNLTKSAAFLGDLGNNLLGEAKAYLNKQNPTIFDPTTGSPKATTNVTDAQSNSAQKVILIDEQKKLFADMKAKLAPMGFNFEGAYPELRGLDNMEQVYRKAWDLSVYRNAKQNFYKDFVRKIYEKYYKPDVNIRYKIRQLG
jgi:hypothetical protein